MEFTVLEISNNSVRTLGVSSRSAGKEIETFDFNYDEEIDRFYDGIGNSTLVMPAPEEGLFDLEKTVQSKGEEALRLNVLDLQRIFAFLTRKGKKTLDQMKAFFQIDMNMDDLPAAGLVFLELSKNYKLSEEELMDERYDPCFVNSEDIYKAGIAEKEHQDILNADMKAKDFTGLKELVFFDLECANENDGIGKICEFGAVVTDADFNILRRVHYLINPEDVFALSDGWHLEDGLPLTLDYGAYKFYPELPHFEKEIRKLLEAKDNLVFGFAVDNDIDFLATDLVRYRLPAMNYLSFDAQIMLKKYLNTSQRKSLSHAYELLYSEDERQDFTAHSSVQDAEMTMLVARRLFEKAELTLKDIPLQLKDCLLDSKGILQVKENHLKEFPYGRYSHFRVKSG